MGKLGTPEDGWAIKGYFNSKNESKKEVISMRKYFPCDCGDAYHFIVIENWKESSDELYSVWTVVNRPPSFKKKLECIWNLLKGNDVLFNEILFTRDDLIEIKDHIEHILEENKDHLENHL